MRSRNSSIAGYLFCVSAGLLLGGCGGGGGTTTYAQRIINLNMVNGVVSSPIFSSEMDAKTLASTDIGWVDQVDANNARYYITDRGATNQTSPGGLGRVWAIDTVTDSVLYMVTGFVGKLALPSPNSPTAIVGYNYADANANVAVKAPVALSNISGPNGVVVVNPTAGGKELWAGDGNGSVKVADLTASSPQITHTIATGGFNRSDELAYDPDHDTILIGNDADAPVFLTFINRATYKIKGQIAFDTKSALAGAAGQKDVSFATAAKGSIAAGLYGHGPNSTGGMEQPVYVPATKLFYIAMPATTENPNGEVDAIDPVLMKVVARYPTATAANAFCSPHGLALGPSNHIAIACGDKVNMGIKVMDVTTGTVIADIAQTGGSDMAWYNKTDNRYYIGAGSYINGGIVTPMISAIDAATNLWIKNIVTGSIKDGKSVAVSPINNRAFVPVSEYGGIAVFQF